METVTVGLSAPLARRLEQLSTEHGPGYVDHLLECCAPAVENDGSTPEPLPIDEWVPKIGVDAVNKSVEIDVGSQVVVVNLADFYKPRDAAQLFGGAMEGAAGSEATPSGLHLLASTANLYRDGDAAKPRFTCVLCHAVFGAHMPLRVHCASAHGTQLAVCTRCGHSFLSQRELDKHPCEEQQKEQQRAKPRVPPLVVRPPKGHRVRRLEDTSSSEESDDEEEEEEEEKVRRHSPPPPPPRPVARRPPPLPPAPPPPPAAQRPPPNRPPNGKKEAYVCRVCQSKFRDPKSVLNHLKEFHSEHARKAWNKFQENLRSRGSAPAGAARPGAAGDASTFAVRSVAPMKLKLSRSQQRHRLQPPLPPLPPPPPPRRELSPPAPSSDPAAPPSPGFVCCAVCGGTKYYTHTARCLLDGSYACESCRKFAGLLQPTQPIQCLLGLGTCHIPVLAPRRSAEARCRACWLKKCLLAFNMAAERHDKLRDCLPPSIRRTVPTAAEKPFRQMGKCELDPVDE